MYSIYRINNTDAFHTLMKRFEYSFLLYYAKIYFQIYSIFNISTNIIGYIYIYMNKYICMYTQVQLNIFKYPVTLQ